MTACSCDIDGGSGYGPEILAEDEFASIAVFEQSGRKMSSRNARLSGRRHAGGSHSAGRIITRALRVLPLLIGGSQLSIATASGVPSAGLAFPSDDTLDCAAALGRRRSQTNSFDASWLDDAPKRRST
jgi:hypothetical protein